MGIAESAINTSADMAALPYLPVPVAVQISVANVVKPVGRKSSVIGSSFITVRKTNAAPAAIPGRASGQLTRRMLS